MVSYISTYRINRIGIVVCTDVYISGINSIPKTLRHEVASGKEVGGMVYLLNDVWGPQLRDVKDDSTGLRILTSLQLWTPSVSLWIMDMYCQFQETN